MAKRVSEGAAAEAVAEGKGTAAKKATTKRKRVKYSEIRLADGGPLIRVHPDILRSRAIPSFREKDDERTKKRRGGSLS